MLSYVHGASSLPSSSRMRVCPPAGDWVLLSESSTPSLFSFSFNSIYLVRSGNLWPFGKGFETGSGFSISKITIMSKMISNLSKKRNAIFLGNLYIFSDKFIIPFHTISILILLVFGSIFFSSGACFYKWLNWLIRRSLAFIVPTTSLYHFCLAVMEKFEMSDLGRVLKLTDSEESTIEVPANAWQTDSWDVDLCLVG